MRKILSVAEFQNSEWSKLFEEAFGDNLVSAFVHGDCLMEGFSALESPWTVSFILKSNSVEDMLPLQKLTAKAKHENIVFNHVFSRFEIKSSQDVFPLEFLHIKSKNVTICGETNANCADCSCIYAGHSSTSRKIAILMEFMCVLSRRFCRCFTASISLRPANILKITNKSIPCSPTCAFLKCPRTTQPY